MTRLWTFGFEVSPSGTALTTANTNYGAMVGGGTGSKASDSSTFHSGSFSGKFISNATDTAAGAYTFTDRTEFHYRTYLRWSTVPGTTTILVTIKDNANANTVCQIALDTAGKLRLRDSTNATLSTSSAAPGINTWVEVEVDITNLSGTPHVTARAQWGANLDTLTYNWDAGDNTSVNGNVGRVVEGSSTLQAISVWVDDSAGDDALQPGPSGLTSIPPVAHAGPDDEVEPFVTVTLDGTSSTFSPPDDGVTYAWTQTAGTTVTLSDATAASPTFQAPGALADANLTFSLTVTGNNSLVPSTSPDTVVITVLAATEAWLNPSGTWKAMEIAAL